VGVESTAGYESAALPLSYLGIIFILNDLLNYAASKDSHFHRTFIVLRKCFSTFAIASRKSVESTMLYRSNVDSVRCPEIFIATLLGTPDRMRFLTPLTKIVNQQALVLPNLGACLHSQSYPNARGLKSLAQVPCVEYPAFPRQIVEHFSQFHRKRKENRLFVLCLFPLKTRQHPSVFELDLRPCDRLCRSNSASCEI
jgi:hypothetical protein